MEFLNTWAFLGLLIIPLFFVFKPKKLQINPKIVIKTKFTKKIRFFIFLTAYVLLITALARPVILNSTQKVKVSNLNLVVLLDASKGMACKDIYPNRFEAAINKLKELFKHLRYQNTAVILVGDNPYLLSPLTTDYSSIIYLLEHIDKKEILKGESNFFKAYKTAEEIAPAPRIFLTISYKAIPYKNTINYVIGHECFMDNIDYSASNKGIKFSYSNSDVLEIANKINSFSKSKEITVKKQKELFYYPLLLALVLIFMGSFSIRTEK